MRNTLSFSAAIAALFLSACDAGQAVTHIESTGGHATCNWHDCRRVLPAMRWHNRERIASADKLQLLAITIEEAR